MKEGSPLLTEEIFGPILPIVKVKSVAEAVATVHRSKGNPLVMYIFSNDNKVINECVVIRCLSFQCAYIIELGMF